MENIYKITWSDEALKNLRTIINYLENNWTDKELKQFAKRLEKRLNLIHKNPKLIPGNLYINKHQAKCFIKTNIHLLSNNTSENTFNHFIR